jgi:hypothetical protein
MVESYSSGNATARGNAAGTDLCDPQSMARAVAQYAFAALLALLSTQALVPSLRAAPGIEIVCSSEAEQRVPREVRRIRAACVQVRPPAPPYVSRTRPEPDAVVLFQRPPPTPSLFS